MASGSITPQEAFEKLKKALGDQAKPSEPKIVRSETLKGSKADGGSN